MDFQILVKKDAHIMIIAFILQQLVITKNVSLILVVGIFVILVQMCLILAAAVVNMEIALIVMPIRPV